MSWTMMVRETGRAPRLPAMPALLVPLIVLTLFAVIASACGAASTTLDAGSGNGSDIPGVSVVEPSAGSPAAAVEAVSAEELSVLVSADNDFAARLYRVLADDGTDNIALGTWSISEGLALPYVGAEGTTADQMSEVLGYTLAGDTQHQAFNTLRGELLDRTNDGLSLEVANRLFGQTGYGFLDGFLADVSRYYAAPLATVDFGDADVARQAINDWTADQTNDNITDLFPPGTIDPETRLVLVNAIHLDADWYFPFNPDLTRLQPFTTADGPAVDAAMMHFNEFLPIARVGEHVAVQLPYSGRQMSMIAVLPGGSLAGLEADLGADFFTAVNSGLEDSGIHLALPKFELSFHTSLVDPLKELGMTEPFGAAADFSGMTGSPDLFISAIEHETVVKIDETGTEASAATGTAMAGSHGPTVEFDRPFVFWVQDDVTGAVLFLGRVTDPG